MPPADGAAGERHRDRLRMGPGAVLTVNEAAALLPIADRDARAWLHHRGLVRSLAGRDVVLWIDVLDELRAGEVPATEAPRVVSRTGPLPRVRLSGP